jgi:hypothetical protein
LNGFVFLGDNYRHLPPRARRFTKDNQKLDPDIPILKEAKAEYAKLQ